MGLVREIRNKINSSYIFERIYVLFVTLITALLWSLGTLNIVPFHSGLVALTIIASVTLLLLNDFKYFVPCVISFIFANPDGYKSAELPVPMIACGFTMVGVLIAFTAFNFKKITFKNKNRSYFALIYFAIFSFLPLTYHNLISSSTFNLVWVYFSYLLYLGIYLFFLGNFNSDSKRITFKSCEMVAILLTIECLVKVAILHKQNPYTNILSMWYYLGWGLCNEAGILMCFSLPFLYMKIKNYSKWYQFLLFSLQLSFVIVGMFVTTSRGTYLFGGLALICLSIYSLIKQKHKALYICSILLTLIILILATQFTFGIKDFVQDVVDVVFKDKLNSNGRFELFNTAVKLWQTSPLTIIFGTGWVAEIVTTMTHHGMQEAYMVYHSTFFETLCCFGAIGLYVMIFHFYEKYKQLEKLDTYDFGLLLIGYAAVDLYGMIDNSYNYYYYMIPLVILMASLDATKKEKDMKIVESDV